MVYRLALAAMLVSALASAGCSRPGPTSDQATPVSEATSALPDITSTPLAATEAPTTSPTPDSAETPTVSPAVTSGATGVQSPTAQPAALASPTTAPAENLLSWTSGAIPRVWPATAEGATRSAGAVLADGEWESKRGARPPFTFVFEFAAPAMVERVGFTVPNDARAQKSQSASVAFSTASADSGFADAGTYTLTSNGSEETFTLSHPTAARWVRISIDPGNGAQALLKTVSAYGTAERASNNLSYEGTWLYDEAVRSATDPLFGASEKLTGTEGKPIGATYATLKTIQSGASVQGFVCGKSPVWHAWRGELRGERVQYTSTFVPYSGSATINKERTILVGTNGLGVEFVAFRVRDSNPCSAPSIGHGKTVAVITMHDAKTYVAAEITLPLPGYRFVPVPAPLLRAQDLARADVAVLASVCLAGQIFADWQARTLLDYVKAGHTLIIHDSDGCKQTDYSFLPYLFKSSNPGALGARGNKLVLVESDTLGADKTDPAHFLDVKDYVALPQDLGDANTVYSQDLHWCGHLFGTNAKNVDGYTDMYAHYGRGLIIYNGLDSDDSLTGNRQSLRLLRFELQQRPDGFLPCSQPVAGAFDIAPSSRAAFVPRRRQRITIPLQVLANQGWKGTVNMSLEMPAGVVWPASLSPSRVMLHGNVAAISVAIDVPQTANAGTYGFSVHGTDGRGHDAQALITLFAGKETNAIKQSLATTGRVAVYGIHFDFDSDRIRPESRPVLSEIAQALHAAAQWRLVIEGHTDRVGSDAYNRDLSARRAAAVKSALVADYRVDAARLSTLGYGASRPKATNDTAAGRALNRRVELVRH